MRYYHRDEKLGQKLFYAFYSFVIAGVTIFSPSEMRLDPERVNTATGFFVVGGLGLLLWTLVRWVVLNKEHQPKLSNRKRRMIDAAKAKK